MTSTLQIANKTFRSRLFLGTGKFGNLDGMNKAITRSQTQLVTMALKRVDLQKQNDELLSFLQIPEVDLLPNTSGARNASEAVLAAQLAREAIQTNWIKLEIHPDPRYLMPDPIETLQATQQLAAMGFIVLPYIHADPVLCKRLEEAGSSAVMPLGAPIGSNKGLRTRDFLEIIIEQSQVPVIVDAGIGAPSDAALAMELGADAVLVNTAIAAASDPIEMAEAFRLAVISGRLAYESGLAPKSSAASSSPLTEFLID